jgi:single-stranded DNA-binding protein
LLNSVDSTLRGAAPGNAHKSCANTTAFLERGVRHDRRARFREPVPRARARMAKSGKPFVTATLKVRDRDATQWIKLTAFSDSAQEDLMRLGEGDAVSAQGALTAETYTASDSTTKLSLSIIIDKILYLKQPPKQREVKLSQHPDARSKTDRQRTWRDELDGPNDDIGF